MDPFFILIYRIIDIYFYIILANVILSWLIAFNIINTYNQRLIQNKPWSKSIDGYRNWGKRIEKYRKWLHNSKSLTD